MSRQIFAALAAIGIGLPAIALADERLPMMDHEHRVHCVPDKQGQMWRIQCDDVAKVCIFAAEGELDSTGARTHKELERARECIRDLSFDRDKLAAAGYTFIPGRA
ncbi:MAG TPA: hypothetical protein VIV11_19060, partial [Kofleriaceae bacterium]